MGRESNKERLRLSSEVVVTGCLAEEVTLEVDRDQLMPVLRAPERPGLWLSWEPEWRWVLCGDEAKRKKSPSGACHEIWWVIERLKQERAPSMEDCLGC